MDGIDRANPIETGIAEVLLLNEHGYETRLPIVQVDDVRDYIEASHYLERGTAEPAKALRLKIACRIDIILLKIVFVVGKIIGHAVKNELLRPDILLTPAHADAKIKNMLHIIAVFFWDHAVFRNNDGDLRSQLCKRFGKRACDVGKTARLNKRGTFG